MNKKESFEEYKKIYIEGCKQHIPWRLDDAIEMFSAFPVHTELMHADLKDKYEKLLAEKDKQLESAREIIGHYVEMDIYTYGAMAREWLKQNGGESE